MKHQTINSALQYLSDADRLTFDNLYRQSPLIFDTGQYIPLKVKGKQRDNLMAAALHQGQNWYLMAFPVNMPDEGIDDWGNTKIILQGDMPSQWQYLSSDVIGHCDEVILMKDITPLTLLKLTYPNKTRGAGVLMHITSLPSPFPIGDLGPGAFAFADFLASSRQTYWQMLPVNPTEAESDQSPYSSTSSMAGNVLLISPELLMQDGLLSISDLEPYMNSEDRGQPVDYAKADAIKTELFDIAYRRFLSFENASKHLDFESYKRTEAYWLNDFALFGVLKTKHGHLWHEWPNEYKFREKKALNAINKEMSAAIDKIKWLQYIFSVQWTSLKQYSNMRRIKLFGDMPFYMNYNSSDVWAQPEIFNLDEAGNVLGMAGVPPDYFSADGQLWGMPTYKWEGLKISGYQWWIRRIKKNLEYFDLIRLDHFRAFADYWEVPAGEITAVNGQWKIGPGSDFFKTVEKEIGALPLIAEDLGDMNDLVYNLRDEFKLPGMKVLQFAFDPQMAYSTHIPHNHIENSFAYTGTHDNNTTLGWYAHTEKDERERITQYTGFKIKRKNAYKAFVKMAYASVAKTAIIPMQDVLGLGEQDRMNIPSSTQGNWAWRLKPGYVKSKAAKWLRNLVIMYNR
jgi:4-alpha-glucanotransferase